MTSVKCNKFMRTSKTGFFEGHKSNNNYREYLIILQHLLCRRNSEHSLEQSLSITPSPSFTLKPHPNVNKCFFAIL